MVEFYLLLTTFSGFPLQKSQNKNPALTRKEFTTSALTSGCTSCEVTTRLLYSSDDLTINIDTLYVIEYKRGGNIIYSIYTQTNMQVTK